MKALKKTSAALIAFAVSASAFAGTDMESRVSELEKKVDMMSTTTALGTFGPNTALARAEPNGMGWRISVDVLYWQTKVGGTEYAVGFNGITNSSYARKYYVQEPKFQWDFGFKVGVGYNFDHDGWETNLQYTYLRNNAQDHVIQNHLPSGVLSSIVDNGAILAASSFDQALTNGTILDYATEGKAYVRNKYDNLKLDLARDFFVSKYLSVRPNFGVQATWINLTRKAKFTGGQVAFTAVDSGFSGGITKNYSARGLGSSFVRQHVESNFFGVGPKAGVDSRWHLVENFCLYANSEAALLFGRFKLSRDLSNTANRANSIDGYFSFHRLNPMVRFDLGVTYDKYMMCDTQHLGISLGYENVYYWDVNVIDLIPAGVGMYGVTLKFVWDF
jgi:hypothetical protein